MAAWPYEPQAPRVRRRHTFSGVLVYLGMLALSVAAWWIIIMGVVGLIR